MPKPLAADFQNNPSHSMLHQSPLNVKAYGAVGDGVTDDTAAIQAAISAAAVVVAGNLGGGPVFFPPGIYLVSSQIQLQDRVRLVGAGRDVTRIKAAASFPINTPVVRLGIGSDLVYACRLENLEVDCSNIAGSTGVYSNEAQEHCGVFFCFIRNFKDRGIHFVSPAQQVDVFCSEVYGQTAAGTAIGIDASGNIRIRSCSIFGDGLSKLASGVRASASNVSLQDVHVEAANIGLDIPTDGGVGDKLVTGFNFSGFGVSPVVSIDVNYGSNTVFSGVKGSGAATVISDAYQGLTLTTDVQFYASSHQGYIYKDRASTVANLIRTDQLWSRWPGSGDPSNTNSRIASVLPNDNYHLFMQKTGTGASKYGFYSESDGVLYLYDDTAGQNLIGFVTPTVDNDTGLFLVRREGGSLSFNRVTQGAVDSGGVGFRLLRIPN